MQNFKTSGAQKDPARAAIDFFQVVQPLAECVASLEKVRVPVIASMNGLVIGAGIDFTSAADIRYCSRGTTFTIKELDYGLAADIGTLQRFQKVVGNKSWARELALTARFFSAEESLEHGFVSKVTDTPEQCLEEAIKTAKLIAEKSPVAITATKLSLIYSRDNSVQAGLDHIATLNSAMLQTDDLLVAASALATKQKPIFPKL